MSFRRIPFQFSTSDPAERQRELEKRFGVPSQNKMYVDASNPVTMGSGFNSRTSSPRFQHRVPMFVDRMPARSSVDSLGCENKSPKVRVIPIQIEKEESSPSSRHRTFSGPAGISEQPNKEICPPKDDASPLKRSMEDLSKPSKIKAASKPRVYNIPIKVEQSGEREKKTKFEKGKIHASKSHSNVNGCENSKHEHTVESEVPIKEKETENERVDININNALKKIDCVLEEFKTYETEVKEFNGTAKDKQYRYLDEMLTRCMIKLDDIETMGSEKVRSARKKVVKMVQASVDLLESKVNAANNPDTAMNTSDSRTEATDKQDNARQPTDNEENTDGIDAQSNVEDIPEGNQHEVNTSESSQNDLSQEEMQVNHTGPEDVMRNDVPEVEMAEVTSTSSDLNQNGTNNLLNSEPEVTNSTSDEIIKQPSVSNEIEMTEVATESHLQDKIELPKPIVSSTNISSHENEQVNPAQVNTTDIPSTCNSSSKNQEGEDNLEVSSTILHPETVNSNLEVFSDKSTILEDCKIMKNVETLESDIDSTSDANIIPSIPEVEMKEIVENSCMNNTSLHDL